MTIQSLEQLETGEGRYIPPIIKRAAGLVAQLEAKPEYAVQVSGPEAAIMANRAFLAHQDEALEAAAEHASGDPNRAQQLMSRAGQLISSLLDQALVLANQRAIDKGMEWVKEEAARGNRMAEHALNEHFCDDSTGPVGKQGESIGPERFAAFDKQLLAEAQEEPIQIEFPEAEIALAASVAHLEEALAEGDRAAVIELSGAVRLVIDHVPEEAMDLEPPLDFNLDRTPLAPLAAAI
jgi:hypothetical protein